MRQCERQEELQNSSPPAPVFVTLGAAQRDAVWLHYSILKPLMKNLLVVFLLKEKCSLPQIVSIHHLSVEPAESRESCCKQTAETEHRHSTFGPRVYERLYILHWLCLKIDPHIQTNAALCVCAWAWGVCTLCAWGGEG